MIIEQYQHACRVDLDMVHSDYVDQLLHLSKDLGAQETHTLISAQLPHYGIGVAPDISMASELESFNIYNKLVASDQWLGSGSFSMYSLPAELNQLLLNNMPNVLKELFPEPYIRLQVLDRFQIPPHEDPRTITIIVPLTDSQIQTVFYQVDTKHDYFRGMAADPDLITEVHRNTFQKNQAWVLNTKAVHGTQGIESAARVTINFNWTGITYQEFISALAASRVNNTTI